MGQGEQGTVEVILLVRETAGTESSIFYSLYAYYNRLLTHFYPGYCLDLLWIKYQIFCVFGR